MIRLVRPAKIPSRRPAASFLFGLLLAAASTTAPTPAARAGTMTAVAVATACAATATTTITAVAAATARIAPSVMDTGDEERARLIGVLTHTRLTVRIDDQPARDVFSAIARAVNVPILGRYSTDQSGSRAGAGSQGINPLSPISLRLEATDALTILEMVLEQCEQYEPCTWQLRNGYVEVGTKERLSTPAATQRRHYPIRDLMIEMTYNAADAAAESVSRFDDLPYSTAAISRPAPLRGREARKRPEELALEMVHAIVALIEPGNWDYGQFDGEEESDPRIDDRRTAPPRGGGSFKQQLRDRVRLPRPHKIATIRFFRESLLVTAPDFIHRQINGYPKPIKPAPLSAQECEERSQAASTERLRIDLLATNINPDRRRWQPGGGGR